MCDKRHWTACKFDFNHDGDYDESILKMAIQKALDEMDCDWTGYVDFENVDEAYEEE